MKLTLKEVTALRKMQDQIYNIKAAVADRAHLEVDTNAAETDITIKGLDCMFIVNREVVNKLLKIYR